jgi:hypothetical protein
MEANMKLIIFICLFFIQNVHSNTLDEAKQFSYQGSLHYINREFNESVKKFNKSLEIRKKLGNIDKNYITVLKLFILSKYRTGDFCSISLSEDDRMLLIGDNDLDFLHEFGMIRSSCF